jgi:hypothetical protein
MYDPREGAVCSLDAIETLRTSTCNVSSSFVLSPTPHHLFADRPTDKVGTDKVGILTRGTWVGE